MSLLSKAFGGVGKALGGVASIAAPFLPGPWGAVAGIAGGLLGQGAQQSQADAAQKKADAAYGAGQKLAQQQLAQYTQYSPALLSAMLSGAGIDPTTGKTDASYNPYGTLTEMLYGDNASTTQANRLFDPSQLNSQFLAQQEATDGQYDSAVSAALADSLGRGFAGGNTATAGTVAGIRRAQASDNAGGRRSLLSSLLAQKNNFLQGQLANRANLLTQGAQQKQNNLLNAGAFLSGSASQGLGTMGGLGGFYQSQANNAQGRADATGAGISNMIGGIAASGGLDGFNLGNIFGRRKTVDPSKPGAFTWPGS